MRPMGDYLTMYPSLLRIALIDNNLVIFLKTRA